MGRAGMTGLSPDQVIEMKHSLAGIAELMRSYFDELRKQGFTDDEALRIAINWQSILLGNTGDSE